MSYLNSENGAEGLRDKHMGHVRQDQYTISQYGCEEQVIAQKVQRKTRYVLSIAAAV